MGFGLGSLVGAGVKPIAKMITGGGGGGGGAPALVTSKSAPAPVQRMVPADIATGGLRSQRSKDVASAINAQRAARRQEVAASVRASTPQAPSDPSAAPVKPDSGYADGGLVKRGKSSKSCEQTGNVGSLYGKNMKK